jgi:hypothetical protein
MKMKTRIRIGTVTVMSALLVVTVISGRSMPRGLLFAENFYWVIVDEHDVPLPAPPPEGRYLNCIGGDRGKVRDEDIDYRWDGDSTYTAVVTHIEPGEQWTFGGMWCSLVRVDDGNMPLDFRKIFGPYIKDEYQGEIVELEIIASNVISPSGNSSLKLKVELKDEYGNPCGPSPWFFYNLISETYPRTFTIALNPIEIQDVEQIVWVMDNAQIGDSISADRIRLKSGVPSLYAMPAEEQAFLWTYSWLMSNYNPETGMVQDKSRDKEGSMEGVTPTAKTAKLTYYAFRKGYVSYENAVSIITKIADTLINVVPRGPAMEDRNLLHRMMAMQVPSGRPAIPLMPHWISLRSSN